MVQRTRTCWWVLRDTSNPVTVNVAGSGWASVGVGDGDDETLGLGLTLGDGDALTDGDGETLGEGSELGDSETVGLAETDGDGDSEAGTASSESPLGQKCTTSAMTRPAASKAPVCTCERFMVEQL